MTKAAAIELLTAIAKAGRTYKELLCKCNSKSWPASCETPL